MIIESLEFYKSMKSIMNWFENSFYKMCKFKKA